jgi:hypothetical protein
MAARSEFAPVAAEPRSEVRCGSNIQFPSRDTSDDVDAGLVQAAGGFGFAGDVRFSYHFLILLKFLVNVKST